jgi:inhibitor of cysteine peptidase
MSSAATKVITEADKGGVVQLQADDRIELRLRSNPSTGYTWRLQNQSTSLLKLVGQSQTKPSESGVGRPVIQVFEFQVKHTGAGVLLLRYMRPWEKSAPEDEQFDLHVLIQ